MIHCFECEMMKMRHIDISAQFITPTKITFSSMDHNICTSFRIVRSVGMNYEYPLHAVN